MATPFANPERQFRARRDTLLAPIHNFYTFNESESSESESEDVGEIDIKTLTLEHYLTLNNTRGRISNPENATFEIKGQLLRELRKITFLGSSAENAIEHIEKVLKVANLFNINDSALLRVFPLTLVGVKRRILKENGEGNQYIPRLVYHEIKIEEVSMVKLNARCSAILQNELPPEEKDSGSFILSCAIGTTTVSNALADLGQASVLCLVVRVCEASYY
ncbi:hypothetical protein Tco_0489144 [Tanacetum coccineum]